MLQLGFGAFTGSFIGNEKSVNRTVNHGCEVSIKVSPPCLGQLGGHFRLILAATDHEGLPKSFK